MSMGIYDCWPITCIYLFPGYRFGHNGGVSFTQVVDSAQKEYFIEVTVMTSSVKVQMFDIERLQRKQGPTETRMCALGQSYRVFTHQDA